MPIHDPAILAAFGATPDATRARLQQELDAFQAALSAHPLPLPAALPGRPWSAAQLVEHVVLVNEGVARVLKLLASDRDVSVYPYEPAKVRDGRIQAPPMTLPGDGLDRDTLDVRWTEANARLVSLAGGVAGTDPTRTFPHPVFGPLNALDWLRMAAFHTRHHRKQLEAARSGAATA